MNILIPMSGKGQRFVEAGFSRPKPLIDMFGKPLIQRVVESIGLEGHYIYCLLKEHEEKYNISKLLTKITPGQSTFVIVDKITEGAACTCLLAEKYINNENPLIISNCDQIIEYDRPLFIGNTLYYDGCILNFPAFDNKWSFCLTDENDIVKVVVEKEIISTLANTGIYSFKRGRDFVNATKTMIKKEIRINNEFYVAPVYNELIKDGQKIKSQMVKTMMPAGTPTDLNTTLKVLYYKNK